MDILYLDGRPVLHLVDESTRFSAAGFLSKMTTDSVWDLIAMSWSSIYTGLRNTMVVDEGSQFRKVFTELATIHDVNVEKTDIESHNSLGTGERYHKPLRDTYLKLKIDHPTMQRQILLALYIKAMNDTLGPEGIVPSALVFGEFPSLRSLSGPIVPRLNLAERAQAAEDSKRIMIKSLAQAKISRALRQNTPPASKFTYQTGNEVLVWREKVVENRIGQ